MQNFISKKTKKLTVTISMKRGKIGKEAFFPIKICQKSSKQGVWFYRFDMSDRMLWQIFLPE
ncbi:MAG: hypothetical protein AAF433_08775 [Bacteroidota bacterium]